MRYILLFISVKRGLGDPIVSANLPITMQSTAQALLAKETCDWSTLDKSDAGSIVSWALSNLQ